MLEGAYAADKEFSAVQKGRRAGAGVDIAEDAVRHVERAEGAAGASTGGARVGAGVNGGDGEDRGIQKAPVERRGSRADVMR